MQDNAPEDFMHGLGIEIILAQPEAFLKVKETLTRLGIGNSSTKILTQTTHILHKRGRYFILHFKELFILDGNRSSPLSEEDIKRRNLIAYLVNAWGLAEVKNPEVLEDRLELADIKIIKFQDKGLWDLRAKYLIGVNRNRTR